MRMLTDLHDDVKIYILFRKNVRPHMSQHMNTAHVYSVSILVLVTDTSTPTIEYDKIKPVIYCVQAC